MISRLFTDEFLGLIFAPRNTKDSRRFHYIDLKGSTISQQRKVPSRIAYCVENKDLLANAWGFGVKPKFVSCWTKLLLDKNAVAAQEDDIKDWKNIDDGMMRLPPARSASQVVEEFLHEMYLCLVEEVEKFYGATVLEVTPIDCWITLPAIWSDEAKQATPNSTIEAGFAKRSIDQIHTIAEPEAAAIATLKELSAPGTLNACGDNILICDGGGGTVDLTAYTVTSVIPNIKFKELCIGTGPGSTIMNNWEWIKKDFGHNEFEENAVLGPIFLNVPGSHQYDSDEHSVILSHQTAVLRGTAARALEGIVPSLRYARRHYGFGDTSMTTKARNVVQEECGSVFQRR
ncbi:hypothetical protein DID88_006952 [Monilinia fructigena]|uniref:Uncharacterized protein n=1 Tax=Monilinia fructigena TaxID=38457 RepID=A0A395IFU1_9HELO|nr:hypothetical protein DID88_006952 [Monilinia fructigena]